MQGPKTYFKSFVSTAATNSKPKNKPQYLWHTNDENCKEVHRSLFLSLYEQETETSVKSKLITVVEWSHSKHIYTSESCISEVLHNQINIYENIEEQGDLILMHVKIRSLCFSMLSHYVWPHIEKQEKSQRLFADCLSIRLESLWTGWSLII